MTAAEQSFEGLELPPELLAQLTALLPKTAHREVLVKRLSLPRTITPALFGAALVGLDEPVPSWERFAALQEIQAIPPYADRFTLAPAVRAENLLQWAKEPAERAEWAGRFVAVLDPEQEVEALDRLQLLFFSDQQVARKELLEAFNEADGANDIPRCGALVELISWVGERFDGSGISDFVSELRARYQARNLFLTEFYQTTHYFHRANFEGKLTEFLASKDPHQWVFHIHATGGMGKTTLLRHYISHLLVVEPERKLCAWLDFDYLEVTSILKVPWLLALPLAAQWNEQLEQPRFSSLLSPSNQGLASLLFRARVDGSASGLSSKSADGISRSQYRAGRSNPMRTGMLAGAVPPADLQTRNQQLALGVRFRHEWEQIFPHDCAELPPTRPLLLFLDTLEEASLHHAADLREVLKLVRTFRERVRAIGQQSGKAPPDIRLILSGRYELGNEHLKEFASDFEGQFESHELQGFNAEEARAFLEERMAEVQHHLISAIIGRSLGNPLHLSLFAEWAKDQPQLDEAAVEACTDVNTVMLIERIVKRIPYQPLRWIIRYGVVPRVLSYEFLCDVMQGPLIHALSGAAVSDKTDTPDEDIWTPEANFVFEGRKLWDQCVAPYASVKGWMVPSEADSVGFRSDVLQPMRELLRKQKVFGQLHAQARDWFRWRMSFPEQFEKAAMEFVYHSVQLRTVPGEPQESIILTLKSILDSGPGIVDSEYRAGMAAALLEPDFDELTSPEKAYVEYRLAEAIAAANGYDYRTPEAVRHLSLAFEAAGTQASIVFPPFAEQWMKVKNGASLSQLLKAMEELPPDSAIQLALLIANVGGFRSQITGTILDSAVIMRKSLEDATVPLAILEEKLGNFHRTWNSEESISHLQAAANEFGQLALPAKQTEMLRQVASVELSFGRLARAETALAKIVEDQQKTQPVLMQKVRVELAKGQPLEALELLRPVLKMNLTPLAETSALLLLAEAYSQQMMLDEATKAWADAGVSAQKISDPTRIQRALLGVVKLNAWRLCDANRKRVSSLIENGFSTIRSLRQENQELLAQYELWQIIYSESNRDLLSRQVQMEMPEISSASKIRRTLALAQVIPVPEKTWHQVIDLLQSLPRSSRFVLLDEPVLILRQLTIPEAEKRSLADAFVYEPESEAEAAWYAVRYGELLACLGLYQEAIAILRKHVSAPSPGEWRATVFRERRRIEQRMRDWGAADVAAEPDPVDLWRSLWPAAPFRWAAATIENAKCAMDAGQPEVARECLALADPVLQDVLSESEFHLLARRLHQKLDNAPQEASSFDAPAFEDLSAVVELVSIREQAGSLSFASDSDPALNIGAENETMEILMRTHVVPTRLIGRAELTSDLRDIIELSGIPIRGPKRLWLEMPLPFSAVPWETITRDTELPLMRCPTGWSWEDVQSSKAKQTALLSSRSRDPQTASRLTMLMPVSNQDKESPALEAYFELTKHLETYPNPEELFRETASIKLLYIASCYTALATSGEPAIAGLEMGAYVLQHLLQSSRSGLPPTVILDVPAVRTSVERVRQLLLRNYFAQMVLNYGLARCVICTGLHDTKLMRQAHEVILDGLAKNSSQVEVLDRLSQSERNDSEGNTAALFTTDPSASVLPETR